MQITSVDKHNNLFLVKDLIPQSIVEKILFTPWMELKWARQEGQETWNRRRIDHDDIPWQNEWDECLSNFWPELEKILEMPLFKYTGTAWWVDEPGFTVPIHTDGTMPGAIQMSWIADNADLGTVFYNDQAGESVRYKFLAEVNTGYMMINVPDINGQRHEQWHGMSTPVPEGTFRVHSYSWIKPR